MSRAREQLGSSVIASTSAGYRVSLSADQADASAVLLSAFASARPSRAGDHAAPALRAERASTYRSLVRARALALSGLGRHGEAVKPLTELFRERLRDEEVLLELLRCEAATVGPSAALARYEAYRRSLRDELGTDPGPALQAVHQQLLHHDRGALFVQVAARPSLVPSGQNAPLSAGWCHLGSVSS